MKRRWLQFAVFALLGAFAPALCLYALWPRTGAPRQWSAQPEPPYDPVLFPATRTGGRVYLNGDWSFRLNPDADPVKVKVPHDWTAMRGLERYRGRAVYSRTFRAPRAWKGRRVMLHFEGVAWTADIDLNGERAGRVSSGLFPAAVDITPGLSFDSPNRLQITVSNERAPAGSAVDRAITGAGGLFREIYIQPRPAARVDHIHIQHTDYTGGPASVQFAFTLALPQAQNEQPDDYVLYANILDPGGAVIRSHSQPVATDPSGETPPVEWGAIIQNPEPWSLTNPALYSVLTTLSRVRYGDSGEVEGMETMDETFQSFGLRSFSMDGAGFSFNGESIYLRGADRADDLGPPYGPVQTLDGVAADLERARAAGFNTIRTIYTPPHPALLDSCDRTGIFVIEDLPLYRLTEKQMANEHMRTRAKNLLRAMIRRDAHHPSIIMWGLGHEIDTSSAAGREFADMLRALAAELDPSRPVYLVPPPGRSEPAAPGQPAALNTGFLDMPAGPDRAAALLDAFTAEFSNSPALVFGSGARARINASAGRGRYGTERNQLFHIARARLLVDERPPLDGDFAHALADYPDPAARTNYSGLLSSGRSPKMAYFWLREYNNEIKTAPPRTRRAFFPATPPAIMTAAAALLAFTVLAVWSGFSLGRIMLTDPGQTAPIPGHDAPGDWVAGFLALSLPSFLISVPAGALFLDVLLQWVAPRAHTLPQAAQIVAGLAEDSALAQLALSAAAQFAGLLFSGAAAALFLGATPAAASNMLARCLFPRLTLFLALLLPWPGPALVLAPALWEITLRTRALAGLSEKDIAPWAVAALPAALYACAAVLARIALA